MLPDEARVRRYMADVAQSGPLATVTLSGATFFTSQGRTLNTFTGQIEPSGVTFSISGFYYAFYGLYDPEVVEQVSPTTRLALGGNVFAASSSSSSLSGTFNGSIGVYDNNFRRIVECNSSSHRFVMTK